MDQPISRDESEVTIPGSIDSDISYISAADSFDESLTQVDNSEMINCLRRILLKHGSFPKATMTRSLNSLVALIEDLIHEKSNNNDLLREELIKKDEEFEELKKSFDLRMKLVVEDQNKRLKGVILDQEKQISAAVERASNARRQTASLQSQLSLTLSKIEKLEQCQQEDKNTRVVEKQRLESQLESSRNENLDLKTIIDQKENEIMSLKQEMSKEEKNTFKKDHLSSGKGDCKTPALELNSPKPFLQLQERLSELEGFEGSLQEQIKMAQERISRLKSKLNRTNNELIQTEDKLTRRGKQLIVLSARAKAEKKRANDLDTTLRLSMEKEKTLSGKLRSSKKEEEGLLNSCIISGNQKDCLLSILQSRKKIIAQLELEKTKTDQHLSRLLDRTCNTSQWLNSCQETSHHSDHSWRGASSSPHPQDSETDMEQTDLGQNDPFLVYDSPRNSLNNDIEPKDLFQNYNDRRTSLNTGLESVDFFQGYVNPRGSFLDLQQTDSRNDSNYDPRQTYKTQLEPAESFQEDYDPRVSFNTDLEPIDMSLEPADYIEDLPNRFFSQVKEERISPTPQKTIASYLTSDTDSGFSSQRQQGEMRQSVPQLQSTPNKSSSSIPVHQKFSLSSEQAEGSINIFQSTGRMRHNSLPSSAGVNRWRYRSKLQEQDLPQQTCEGHESYDTQDQGSQTTTLSFLETYLSKKSEEDKENQRFPADGDL